MYFVLPWIVVFNGLFSGLCSHYAKSPQHQVKTHGCPSYTTSLLLFLMGNLCPHFSTFSLPPTWFGINEWDDQWVSCDKWKPSNLTRAKLRTPIFFTNHFAFLLISLSWWHHHSPSCSHPESRTYWWSLFPPHRPHSAHLKLDSLCFSVFSQMKHRF